MKFPDLDDQVQLNISEAIFTVVHFDGDRYTLRSVGKSPELKLTLRWFKRYKHLWKYAGEEIKDVS